MPAIAPLQVRAEVRNRWLVDRLDNVVPELMRREGADMWLIIAGEYNEDPVARTMLPAEWLTARRRTILLFFDRGAAGVERLALTRYPVANFESAWDPDAEEDQWKRLATVIAERQPQTIAVNMAEHFPLADGLSASHLQALQRALGPDLAARISPKKELAIGWLERRIPAEMATYPQLSRITHSIIEEAFSDRVVTPGVTTSDDVVWWLRNRVNGLGLDTWFQPSVAIQRDGSGSFGVQQMGLRGDTVIMPGDMLHVDFGIDYLGLKTDVQRVAYVLRPHETAAPRGLQDGLAAMNRVKSALVANLKPGRSGDATLAAARAQVEAEGVDGTIYSHPLGFHGHGAGTWIGAWERQDKVPSMGEYVIQPRTAWSIELNAQHDVPEWGGQKVRFMYEENGYLDEDGEFSFFDGSQDEFILIPRQ
ncbi:M24 family metallopeptidase [Pacificimonas sp. ICDLI1SI03]